MRLRLMGGSSCGRLPRESVLSFSQDPCFHRFQIRSQTWKLRMRSRSGFESGSDGNTDPVKKFISVLPSRQLSAVKAAAPTATAGWQAKRIRQPDGKKDKEHEGIRLQINIQNWQASAQDK